MSKRLKVLSINFPFQDQNVVQERELANDRALFDFDVVVIRPGQFKGFPPGKLSLEQDIEAVMRVKNAELSRLWAQGGVLVVVIDVPDIYEATTGSGHSMRTRYSAGNYDFLDRGFVDCIQFGSGHKIEYHDFTEPFVAVLKKSEVAWTAYFTRAPGHPFDDLRFFATAGRGTALAGKMQYDEGNLVVLPNLTKLDEASFFEACAEYRYQRQGSTPPDWVKHVFVPGLASIGSEMEKLDKQISDLHGARKSLEQGLEERVAYRKLLYEKGKTQLEPVVRRALDDLGFGSTASEIISGTNYEIDGRTMNGSTPGILEIKGSKKQIGFDEFSPFVVKLLADHKATNVMSKGLLVGNGLCEDSPSKRLGDVVFTPHVLKAASGNSVALINSVELYWLCCVLQSGGTVDLDAVRAAILNANGYADLKHFCGGESPFGKK
jgi:hypothetical protein